MFLTFKTKEEKAWVVWNYMIRNMDLSLEELAKILYIADKNHFNTYGRSIYGENYLALSCGPIPVTLKAYLDNTVSFYPYLERCKDEIYTENNKLRSRSILPQNLDALSKSDLLAINKAADTVLKGLENLNYQDHAWYITPINTIINWTDLADKELSDEEIDDLHFVSRHST